MRADRGASVLVGVVLPERYEPIRRIARGGMATVWCALDRTLDRHVAIKLLAEPYASDELAGRRFKREARAAARLSGHPNVVTIYDVGQTPPDDESRGRPFLVMEYLPAGTVADALRTRQIDHPTALSWLQQAASALDYAHRRGVIHRDVKPANFLLDRAGVLHVADFGIAQLGTEETLTVSGEVFGTAAYLAPERALGRPATAASDRYALAVVAYELLVGERPFGAEHFAAQARQHLEDLPPEASRRNPDLPPALDPVLARGMAKRPEDRFASARELTEAIEAAMVATTPTLPVAPTAVTRPMAAGGQPDGARPVSGFLPPIRRDAAAATSEPQRGASPRQAGLSRTARSRIAGVAALVIVLLGVAIAAAATGTGPPTRRVPTTRHTAAAAHTPASPPKSAKSSSPRAGGTAAGGSASQSSTQTAGSGSGSAAAGGAGPPAPSGGAGALEAQGHALMAAGNYSAAIAVLRQAVATASPGSLTYAYALFDLGRSLRLAGDPRAAVPILWRRLQIPNQIPVVRAELTLALEALGQRASQAPGPGHDHGQHGGGPGGGPGD